MSRADAAVGGLARWAYAEDPSEPGHVLKKWRLGAGPPAPRAAGRCHTQLPPAALGSGREAQPTARGRRG